jgi:hypothetical protein
MLTGVETRAKRHAILDVAVKSISERATGAATSTNRRLAAIDRLVRIAEGPKNRPTDSADMARGRNARVALSLATPFLEQMATMHSAGRIRARAAKLAIRIGELGPAPIGDVALPRVQGK